MVVAVPWRVCIVTAGEMRPIFSGVPGQKSANPGDITFFLKQIYIPAGCKPGISSQCESAENFCLLVIRTK